MSWTPSIEAWEPRFFQSREFHKEIMDVTVPWDTCLATPVLHAALSIFHSLSGLRHWSCCKPFLLGVCCVGNWSQMSPNLSASSPTSDGEVWVINTVVFSLWKFPHEGRGKEACFTIKVNIKNRMPFQAIHRKTQQTDISLSCHMFSGWITRSSRKRIWPHWVIYSSSESGHLVFRLIAGVNEFQSLCQGRVWQLGACVREIDRVTISLGC